MGKEQKSYNVRLYDELHGDLGIGTLKFGGSNVSQVIFKHGAPAALIEGDKLALVKAVEERWNGVSVDVGRTFSLCDCRLQHWSLFADFVIDGDIPRAMFKSIVVRFSEVSEWFLFGQSVEGEVGSALSWSGTPDQINVVIQDSTSHFSLLSEYVSSCESRGEDTLLHEHIEFNFTNLGGTFVSAELWTRTHELSCFFSLLIAHPATALSVFASSDGVKYHNVYFPHHEPVDRDLDKTVWPTYFVQRPQLDGRWQDIFNNYYRSKYRRICWSRLAGMQRYEGFWEYKTLGYVSLLDSYIDLRLPKAKLPAPMPPSKDRLARLRRELDIHLQTLDDEEKDAVVDVAKIAFSSRRATFAEKYRILRAETNEDVLKIVSMSRDDFDFVKDIRDSIAHADDHGLESEEYGSVLRAEAKIQFLLLYYFLKDLGFATQDFIDALSNCRSDLRRIAALDEVHVLRLTGRASFFKVSFEQLHALKTSRDARTFGCCIELENGDLKYSQPLTDAIKAWCLTSANKRTTPTLAGFLGVPENAARVVGHAIFEHGDDHLEVFSMHIVKQADLPAMVSGAPFIADNQAVASADLPPDPNEGAFLSRS